MVKGNRYLGMYNRTSVERTRNSSLTLPYKICQAGEDISLASSNKKNGSRILSEKLTELYAKDRHFLAKMTCNKFESFHDQKT